MEPRRRSAWNWVLNHCYAHCFIWKFKRLSITSFLTRQLSFIAFLVRQHFSCATGHKQDEMNVLVIQSQKSRCLVFSRLNITSPKLAELCTAPQVASLCQAADSKGMSGGRRKYQCQMIFSTTAEINSWFQQRADAWSFFSLAVI